MSTHNICFYEEITKIIPKLSSDTLLIYSTGMSYSWDCLFQEEELQEKRADYERKKTDVEKSMKNIETQERKLEDRRKRFKEDRDKFEDEQDVCNILL